MVREVVKLLILSFLKLEDGAGYIFRVVQQYP